MLSLNKKKEIERSLSDYKSKIDELIEVSYGANENSSKLSKAVYYALKGSGKRFRPSIVLAVAQSLESGLDAAYGALSIELFHTASLIADDLPSMDNDSMRRGKPSLHKSFGEDTALLSSYALIGEGYRCVIKNKNLLKGKLEDLDERFSRAISLLSDFNGLEGAPSGQLLDLYPPAINQESLDLIFYRKTVLFFETAFIFGWLFGGGVLEKFDDVKQCAYHFGMAFQIYDDFCDLKQDENKGKEINYPLSLGGEVAKRSLREHIEKCAHYLKDLSLESDLFTGMLYLMKSPL